MLLREPAQPLLSFARACDCAAVNPHYAKRLVLLMMLSLARRPILVALVPGGKSGKPARENMSERKVYMSPAFLSMMSQRPAVVRELMRRGLHVLLTDVDSVWVCNAWDVLPNLEEYDIVGADDFFIKPDGSPSHTDNEVWFSVAFMYFRVN